MQNIIPKHSKSQLNHAKLPQKGKTFFGIPLGTNGRALPNSEVSVSFMQNHHIFNPQIKEFGKYKEALVMLMGKKAIGVDTQTHIHFNSSGIKQYKERVTTTATTYLFQGDYYVTECKVIKEQVDD